MYRELQNIQSCWTIISEQIGQVQIRVGVSGFSKQKWVSPHDDTWAPPAYGGRSDEEKVLALSSSSLPRTRAYPEIDVMHGRMGKERARYLHVYTAGR